MVDLNIEKARFNMIEQQIRTWDVLDQRVLDIMLRTPREDYVPRQYRKMAFSDMEIPLGHGQVMMAPKLEGRVLQTLNIQPGERVLEVGTGSGHLTALLAGLVGPEGHVFSVDIMPDFTLGARQSLVTHNLDNVTLETGDAVNGWDKHGPYDAIAITGSYPVLGKGLENFKNSLKVGGRLFVVAGEAPIMEALLFTSVGEREWTYESLFDTFVPALVNAPKPDRFAL